MNLLAAIRSRFATALASVTDNVAPFVEMVRPAQDTRFGDFQANCAMPLANQLGTNPREVATKIVAALEVSDLCDPPEIAGPGFINLRLRDARLLELTAELVADERLGHQKVAEPKRVIVDYSSPNVAKPMHVGHLRSSVIGDAVYRLLEFAGHDVTSDNHIGDWGTQFGMIIYGYKHFVNPDAYAADPVRELARLYRLVNQLSSYQAAHAALPKSRERLHELDSKLADLESSGSKDSARKQMLKKLRAEVVAAQEEVDSQQAACDAVESDAGLKNLADAHPAIAEAARNETAKLHSGDAENYRLWEEFLPKCLQALEVVYRRLGLSFDLTLGESFYQPHLADVVQELVQRGLARESDGAMCVFVEGNTAPFIIQKKDKAFTYATTDLATIRYRANELHADVVLYVVDARQSEHFRLLFETSRAWGYEDIEFRHISFGTIVGDDRRPFKTRSGDTVGLESLLDEAVLRARQIVDANDDAKPNGPELDEASRSAVAERVGIGGIKYADLRHNRDSDYVFSWDKMLAKTGDTATYIQYAYARICGIFRKGRVDRVAARTAGHQILFTHESERALAFQLNRFAEVIDGTLAEYRPNFLTNYLFETANHFSTFYDKCPVLSEEEDIAVRNSRLLLCDLTARTLELGLSLLGIPTCEQM